MNYLGIEPKKLTKVVKQLNVLLSNYSVYYQNLRNFHWQIVGINFFEIHRLYEELYNDAKLKVDEIAERIRTLGNKPMGKMSEYLRLSDIKETDNDLGDIKMAKTILDNHRYLIKLLRITIKEAGKAGDEGTIDLLGSHLSEMEKKSWMLNAWLVNSNKS